MVESMGRSSEIRYRRRRRSTRESLVWGFGLILLGCAFLAHRLGYLPYASLTTEWPWFLIVAGGLSIPFSHSAKSLGSNVTFALIGVYCLASVQGWYGLDWRTSWPLAMVAVGAGMIVRAIASPFFKRDVETFEVHHDL